MYAHQVMNDLSTLLERLDSTKMQSGDGAESCFLKLSKLYMDLNLKRLIKTISVAQKFHGPNDVNLHEAFKRLDGSKMFRCGNLKFYRSPYPTCYFDWECRATDTPNDKHLSVKRAALIQQFYNDKDDSDIAMLIDLFSFWEDLGKWMVREAPYIAATKPFALSGAMKNLVQQMGRLTGLGSKYNDDLSTVAFKDDEDGMMWLAPNFLYETKEERLEAEETVFDEDNGDFSYLNNILLLLNCKNIKTVLNEAPTKLNKKRKRNGKYPLFSFKTLEISMPDKNKVRSLDLPTDLHNRIHFCRGHFKEYTSDRPLFGKIVGLWWWQPHVRGQNYDGIVMKDYQIKNDERSTTNGRSSQV